MAARALAFARAALNWAAKREKIPANPLLGLPVAPSAVERDRVLTDVGLAEVWAAVNQMTYPWGPFFRMAILTLQRREEVAGCAGLNSHRIGAMWVLLAARMKNGKTHHVHLSEAARAELRTINKIDQCDYVFSTPGRSPVLVSPG